MTNDNRGDLYRRSIDIILDNQSESGAYIASPTFPQYAYCWLRDGSFTAHAMDTVGEHSSAGAYFRWVHDVVQRYAYKVEHVLSTPQAALRVDDYLHTRYTLDGMEAPGSWWNFQLDGYGTWLWALAEHVDMAGDEALLEEVMPSVELTVRYLQPLWMRPNYDYWEEHSDKVHTSTLASLYGGARALSDLLDGRGMPVQAAAGELARLISEFIRANCVREGAPEGAPYLVKYVGTDAVDASLLAATVPFRLFEPDDPVMVATASKIERDLADDGNCRGVHRYSLDTYYGGGEWVLLSAWLGCYYAQAGDRLNAERCLAWVEAQADGAGNLPEQVSEHLLFPDRYAEWEARWGPPANPLLWSHAMYLLLHSALER
jgi:GH15 family glucan-1,4-alpha-glucosidase